MNSIINRFIKKKTCVKPQKYVNFGRRLGGYYFWFVNTWELCYSRRLVTIRVLVTRKESEE